MRGSAPLKKSPLKGDGVPLKKIEIVGLGALNIDHIYQVERILTDGEAVVNRSVSSPGGSAANTIYGLAKLGVGAGFIGAIGDDAEGKMLLQDFQKVGVDISQIRVKQKAKTGSVLCLTDRLGRRSLYVIPGANNLLAIDDPHWIERMAGSVRRLLGIQIDVTVSPSSETEIVQVVGDEPVGKKVIEAPKGIQPGQ